MPPAKRKAPTKKSVTKSKPKKRSKSAPRVRTAPKSAPNVYHFTRGFDSFATIGTSGGIFSMNTDSRFQIVSLRVKFRDLPDYAEFNSLFSEYKISKFTVQLVPTHSRNMPIVVSGNTVPAHAIPNYEVFVIPVNYTDDALNFASFTGAEIDSYLQQTQRKAMTVMPDRPKTYVVSNPKVVKYAGPPGKIGGTSSQMMGAPYYLSTAAPLAGQLDERLVEHYGTRLLIRRVDGEPITDSGSNQPMGFRVHHQVDFECRKVQ